MKFFDATMPRDFNLGNDDHRFDCDHVWMLVSKSSDGEQFYRCSRCKKWDYEMEESQDALVE